MACRKAHVKTTLIKNTKEWPVRHSINNEKNDAFLHHWCHHASVHVVCVVIVWRIMYAPKLDLLNNRNEKSLLIFSLMEASLICLVSQSFYSTGMLPFLANTRYGSLRANGSPFRYFHSCMHRSNQTDPVATGTSCLPNGFLVVVWVVTSKTASC